MWTLNMYFKHGFSYRGLVYHCWREYSKYNLVFEFEYSFHNDKYYYLFFYSYAFSFFQFQFLMLESIMVRILGARMSPI